MDTNPEGRDFTIVAVPEKNRYELRDGETVAGFAAYMVTPDQIVFTHTVVDETYREQGLGSKLARHVLDAAAQSGKRIVPVCSFIAGYAREHREWDQHLEPSGGASS